MQHRYKPGEVVELVSAVRYSRRPDGPCEIVALLPIERSPLQYRVRSISERTERVVAETDLRLSQHPGEKPLGTIAPLTIAVRR